MAAPRKTENPVDRLAEVPLFKGLPDDALSRIVALARTAEMAAGACFFNEGEPADAFFVLTGGRVKLTQLTPEGHQVVLRIIGPGDAFGGVGAFGEPVYPISAEAIEGSVALRWTSPAMRRLLEREPAVALNALRFVSGRLHDLQRRYRQVMTERVERRIARALVRLAHEAGRRGDEGMEIAFPISRQDVAEMTGTTLYTVSRLLSAWEQQGLIRGGRQRIVVTKPHALVAIADDLPSK